MSASTVARASVDDAAPDLVPDLSPEQLEQLLAERGAPPVLLDVWAPWCQPCLAQAPALQRLAAVTAGRLRVVKLDIQKFPEFGPRMQVRGIPALLLLGGGREIARLTGLNSFETLCEWVETHTGDDALIDTTARAFRPPPPRGGAFYGDAGLREFLLSRLLAQAEQGRLEMSRFPTWHGDRGSVSCALVRSQDPEVFHRLTNLPVAFAAALHFIDPRAPSTITEVFDAVPAGADLRGVVPRLVRRWLGDESVGWTGHLTPAADALRRDWLRLMDERQDGEPPLPEDWAALAERAKALVVPAPELAVQHHFGMAMSRLSPPPADDDLVWSGVLCMYGTYLRHTLTQREMGWTDEDLAHETRREHWFQRHGGDWRSLNDDQRDAVRARYMAEHAEQEAAHDARWNRYVAELETRFGDSAQALRSHLIAALREVNSD